MKNNAMLTTAGAKTQQSRPPKRLAKKGHSVSGISRSTMRFLVGKLRRPDSRSVVGPIDSITPIADDMATAYEEHARRKEELAGQIDLLLAKREEDVGLTDLFRLLRHFAENGKGLSETARREATRDLTRRIAVVVEREEDSRQRVINAFDNWPTYDPDMKESGHEAALETLLKMSLELSRLGFGGSKKPILGGRMFEMSGGTGTVPRLTIDNMTDEERAKLTITLNDVTASMVERAKEKLAGENVTYTSHDIREPAFEPESFDCAVLSQTLELITDPKVLKREKEEPDAVVEDPEHREIKRKVAELGLETLETDGHLHFIVEFPAKFKENALARFVKKTLRKAEKHAFDATFRPLNDRAVLMEKIVRNVDGARILAVLKARIDSRHSEYDVIVRKDRDKLENRGVYLPANKGEARKRDINFKEVERARQRAVQKIITAFTAIDPHFRGTYTPKNGERKDWSEFLEITDETTIINPRPEELMGRRYHTIILTGVLHDRNHDERKEMVVSMMEALENGGSLMLIDEWEPPAGSRKPLRKSQLRDVLMEKYQSGHRVIFESMLRQHIMEGFDSGMYGWHYRKIR